jgi:hypothetical protein
MLPQCHPWHKLLPSMPLCGLLAALAHARLLRLPAPGRPGQARHPPELQLPASGKQASELLRPAEQRLPPLTPILELLGQVQRCPHTPER